MRFSFRSAVAVVAAVAVLASPSHAQQSDAVDAAAVARIRDEGFNRSKVMETMSWLTDVYGPRLTGSPNAKSAADWTVKQMQSWGITSPRLESWGPFGRGWQNERFTANAIAPQAFPILGYPTAWSPSTKGRQAGEVVYAQIDSEADFAKYHGKLKGKWVFTSPISPIRAHFDQADAHRYTAAELAEMEQAPAQVAQQGERARGGQGGRGNFQAMRELAAKRTRFLVDEGALGTIQPGRGDDGTVFTNNGMDRQPDAPKAVPGIFFAAEHYNRIMRMLQKGIPVTVEVEARNTFYDRDLNSFNVVGEIPGTDPTLKDEVVMLGGHFDSWHAGTGATDNAAGSAVMLEAMRILKALGLPMKRTVRIALWTGEEQGLLGSRAYVRQHFGYVDSTGAHLTPENARVAGYFNVDNGTGAIRGVYLQGNEAVRPIFQQWLQPFADLGATTTTIRNTGGTDHLSFDAVGIPGFQFIQDPIDYGTRTHHSNQDVYDRVQDHDMMQNAVIVATFVYQTANREAMLPRKR